MSQRRPRVRRRRRSRRARRRWSSSDRSASACPRSSSPTRARRWRRSRRASSAIRRRRWRWPAVTGTNGKTTTAFLTALDPRGERPPLRAARHDQAGRRRRSRSRRCGRRRRRSTCSGPSPRCWRPATTPCAIEISSHALVLGRADAIHVARRRVHEPDPGPPRLPHRHGGLLRRQAAAVHRRRGPALAAARLGRQRRRRATGAGSPPSCAGVETELDHASRASGAAADLSADGVEFDADGATLHARRRRASASTSRSGCRATSTSRTRSPRSPSPAVSGSPLERGDRGARATPSPCPGRMEPIREGQAFAVLVDYAHTPDSLENVLGAARKLTDGRLISVLGCGGDRDRGQATADGARRRRALRPLRRHLRQPALGGSGRDHRRGPRRDRGPHRTSWSSPTGAAAIALALGRRPSAGDLVVIAGKGHEQGQEFEGGRKDPLRRPRRRPRASSRRASAPAVAGAA